MAKVIGFDKSILKQCTCKKCGAIIKYAPKDIVKIKKYDYLGDVDVLNGISCPNCNAGIIVK